MVDQQEPAPQSTLPAPDQSAVQAQPEPPQVDPALVRKQKLIVAAAIAGGVIIAISLCLIFFWLLQPDTPTETIKNIVIVFLALEMLIVGVAVVILAIQVATLINLLQNEVRPMLQSTNDTINTLRGTTEFLSENLVEPVMQLNEYIASIKRMLELMGLKK